MIMCQSITKDSFKHEKVVDRQFIQLVLTLLCSSRTVEELQIEEELANDSDFQNLYAHILTLRDLSSALRSGDLRKCNGGKGFILDNLKALQTKLKHLRNTNGQLIKLARIDGLTKVFNRMAVDQFLGTAFVKAREQAEELSLLLFDLDHFKKINDDYGHHAGDQVLIQISQVLKKQFRAGDMLARYGGEEFMAVLPGAGGKQAVHIGNRALEAVRKTVINLDTEQQLSITVSVGVSDIRPEDTNIGDMIKRCDRALYEAKNSGRNRLCLL